MQPLLRLPRSALLLSVVSLCGLALFVLAVGVLMQPAAGIVGSRTAELVCLQLAFTPDRTTDILLSFSAQERVAIGDLLLPGDFALAWGYGLVLTGLMGLLAMRLPGKWLRVGAILMWAPLLASWLDSIENMFLYSSVQQLVIDPNAQIAAIIPLLASLAATAKWLALSVVTPAFGLAGIVKGILTDRRFTSWIVYLLLAQALVSMLLKPIQDIPPCFT